jgi:hypothetical protein
MMKTSTVSIAVGLTFAGANLALAQSHFCGNILFNNTLGAERVAAGCPSYLANGLNDVVNPQLANPTAFPPDVRPAATSPALAANDTVAAWSWPVDGCTTCGDNPYDCRGDLVPVAYRGAEARNGDRWYAALGETGGWTYHNFDGLGRTDINYGKPLVSVSTNIASNTTWSSTNNYLLVGKIVVQAGATLTIQPGTVIFGQQSSLGYLVVDRGAKIIAEGTAAAPIVFTSEATPGNMAPGDWGGLVLMGRAIANCADCIGGASCVSEGGAVGQYCGNDDCDSSGSLRYVRVEYAGVNIATDNELNAFTFNALGCGTNLEFLQAHRGLDDLFEWFGGKVSGHHWIGTGPGDDGFDWQMGFRGSFQFGIIQQYEDNGDKAIEADNNEFDNNAPCRSNPLLSNLTLIGEPTGPIATDGINLRRGTDAHIYNSIVINFKERGLDVEGSATCARGLLACSAFAGPTVAVDEFTPAVQVGLRAYPNPVTSFATFAFDLTRTGQVELGVYDVVGRLVSTVVSGELSAGAHEVNWNVPADLAPGVYHYRLTSGSQRLGGKFFRIQ